MEAKDTVMSNEQIAETKREAYHHKSRLSPAAFEMFGRDQCIAQAQAEISFKAGIREVVEWIKGHTLYKGDYTFHIDVDQWQAKLKEWGIE